MTRLDEILEALGSRPSPALYAELWTVLDVRTPPPSGESGGARVARRYEALYRACLPEGRQ